jgi:CxxC motif-containing protein (DUF1111 family)
MGRTLIRIGAAVAALLLFVPAHAVDKASGMDSGGESEGQSFEAQPVEPYFCNGKKKCQGQTCDEVNNQCVGTVTIQPAAGEPLVGLKQGERERFEAGKVLFDQSFVASTGLGPVFNQDSCGSCHSTPLGGSGTITVNRFGNIQFVGPGPLDFTFDPLEALGGSLLNVGSIDATNCGETFPFPETNYAAKRLTNSTLGFGLIEAIPDSDIEANALVPPAPGISGRVHIVPIIEDPGETGVGRFGWKDQLKTVLSFTADASIQEMGITNHILPEDNPPQGDLVKLANCDTVADPEEPVDLEGRTFVDLVTDFQRFLAPPPQTPRSGMTGEAIFDAIGCADCHVRTWQISEDDEEVDDEVEGAISGTTFHPYSDFLLHNMGFKADLIVQGGAQLDEIRTPPLWGLRLRDPLWHDGRVAGGTFSFRIKQVIKQHDDSLGEAKPSAVAFAALSAADQNALIAFTDSLGKREFDMNGDGMIDDFDVTAVEACFDLAGPYTADDPCAVADVDQNGFVDDGDLELLDVVLANQNGDPGDDEDEDSDDETDDSTNDPDGTNIADGFDSELIEPPSGGAIDLGSGNTQGGAGQTSDETQGVSAADGEGSREKSKRDIRGGHRRGM